MSDTNKRTMKVTLEDCLFRRMPDLGWVKSMLIRLTVCLTRSFVSIRGGHLLNQTEGPTLFVFNHNCSFETILMPAYLIYLRGGERIGFVIDWVYGYLPILGWLFRHVDPIYVYNKRAKMPFMNWIKDWKAKGPVYLTCLERLSEGKSLGLFPEGKRNRNPEILLPARKGIGEIILGSSVPVIPIGIDFPFRHKHRRIPRFGRMILNVGERMDFEFERQCKRWLDQDFTLTDAEKRIYLFRLRSRVIHKTMVALSGLSGKSYPYTESLNPVFNGHVEDIGMKEDLCPV